MNELTIKYQIEHAESPYNDWSVKANNNTLITSDVASSYLKYNYGRFMCSDLYNKFVLFNTMQAADLKKAVEAWNADYNPIDNYNGTTSRVVTDTNGDETLTHLTGDESGEHKTIETVATDNAATTTFKTADNDDTPHIDDKTTSTGGTITTNDLITRDIKSHDTISKTVDDTTYSADNIHTETENKHGNLGVTTTQSMIMSECEMRLNPVIKQYLDTFVYQYAVYIGGAWI